MIAHGTLVNFHNCAIGLEDRDPGELALEIAVAYRAFLSGNGDIRDWLRKRLQRIPSHTSLGKKAFLDIVADEAQDAITVSHQ